MEEGGTSPPSAACGERPQLRLEPEALHAPPSHSTWPPSYSGSSGRTTWRVSAAGCVVPGPGWDVNCGEISKLFDGDSAIVMELFEEKAKVREGGGDGGGG